MRDDIQSRLRAYLDCKGLTAKEFERLTGLGNGSCATISERTRRATFDRISNSGIDLNVDWLTTGEGEMTVDFSAVGLAVPARLGTLVNVRYFEVSPTASFREFCASQSGEATVTSVYAPDGRVGRDSCVFRIIGDSMAPQIQPGAQVLCSEVRPTRWHEVGGVVVIAYGERFVIKRILRNRLDSENVLTLGSDNPDYPETETVQLADIRCVFSAERVISQSIF